MTGELPNEYLGMSGNSYLEPSGGLMGDNPSGGMILLIFFVFGGCKPQARNIYRLGNAPS